MPLQELLVPVLTELLGHDPGELHFKPVGGGCICESYQLQLDDGSRFFLKTHVKSSRFPGLFASEFNSLQHLRQANIIKVPKAYTHAENFLLLEYFEEQPRQGNWQHEFGQQLASLHKSTLQSQFGFEHSNYLGTTTQINNKTNDWVSFWRDQRLRYQLTQLRKKSQEDDEVLNRGYHVLDRLDDILGPVQHSASLLHGDLWSGNVSQDINGQIVIYDPASYYGHHEAEFGIMKMFGGFGPEVEQAYQEILPFEQGYERRMDCYRLYHELNHLNLFGRSYYSRCLSTINSLLH